MREGTRFTPLVAAAGTAAYPRLGVIAPSADARDAALAPLGATRLYPSSLDRLEKLEPHRVGAAPCPGAHEFASRLLTLPTHAGLRARHVDEIVRTLERVSYSRF